MCHEMCQSGRFVIFVGTFRFQKSEKERANYAMKLNSITAVDVRCDDYSGASNVRFGACIYDTKSE